MVTPTSIHNPSTATKLRRDQQHADQRRRARNWQQGKQVVSRLDEQSLAALHELLLRKNGEK